MFHCFGCSSEDEKWKQVLVFHWKFSLSEASWTKQITLFFAKRSDHFNSCIFHYLFIVNISIQHTYQLSSSSKRAQKYVKCEWKSFEPPGLRDWPTSKAEKLRMWCLISREVKKWTITLRELPKLWFRFETVAPDLRVNYFQKVLCFYYNTCPDFPKSCLWHMPAIQ